MTQDNTQFNELREYWQNKYNDLATAETLKESFLEYKTGQSMISHIYMLQMELDNYMDVHKRIPITDSHIEAYNIIAAALKEVGDAYATLNEEERVMDMDKNIVGTDTPKDFNYSDDDCMDISDL